ncbi:MAG: class I SAM-dependent rRNA methyltransferase [Bacteroidota bacterium]
MAQQSKVYAVKVALKAEKWIKQSHPWVFDQSIEKVNGSPKTGDVVVIFDQRKNSFLACGFWDAESPIRIKLCQFGKPARLNDEWFGEKLHEAMELRVPLQKKQTNSYRLLYGENDFFPGLICDVYDNVAVLKVYSGIWWQRIPLMAALIQEVTNCKSVILRTSRNASHSQYKDGQILRGELLDPEVIFTEFGLRFKAHVIKGHKTGYFLDHRSNRNRVGQMSKGKDVLDIFSYAGGFSVHALSGGAKMVTSVDISEQALQLAKTNASLNDYDGMHATLAGDAFEVMQDLIDQSKKFHLVIVDPPSFAKKATEVPKAEKAYKRLVQLASKLVSNQGVLVMASCSSRISPDQFYNLVEAELEHAQCSFDLLSRWGHDIDHPVRFPEGEYLKCGFYQIQT